MGSKVDHRKIRKMIEDRKSGIKDSQLFTSRLMCSHLEDINTASTKLYSISRKARVNIVWDEKSDEVAWTDKQIIHLNAANSFGLKTCPRKTRYLILLGINGHELGHVLFTDFLAVQSYFNYFYKSVWYPSVPPADTPEDAVSIKEIFEYVSASPENKMAVAKMIGFINNVIEDGYVEDRVMRYFPGSIGNGLKFVRQLHYEDMPTLSDMIEKEDDSEILTILQLVLSYVKFGKLKYGDTPISDERVQIVFGLLPWLDRAVQSKNADDRLTATNMVLVRTWPYITDFIEVQKKKHDESSDESLSGGDSSSEPAETGTDTSAGSELESEIGKMLDSLVGSSAEAHGSTKPVTDTDEPEESTETDEERAKTAMLAGEDPGEGEEEESGSECGSISGAKATDDADEDHAAAGGSAPKLGLGTVYDDSYEGAGEDRASDELDRLLEAMAESDTNRSLEEMRTSELQEEANGIAYGEMHSGVTTVIHRIPSVSDWMKEEYDEVAAPLLAISKKLQRSVLQKLKDVQRGGKMTGLLMGRRIDCHAIVRNDGRCFYKNSLPLDQPQLAVGLLLDESGSMRSYDRALYARYTAIVIYDFCKSLGIPVTINGHSTSITKKYGHELDMYSYAEFDSIDGNDKYRLMDITDRDNNRDGMALRYIAEKLIKRPEQERILILVSDGQPCDYGGYDGLMAEADLKEAVKEYTRKGILFIAAAIGSDKAEIERIYGDAFMDITDLNKLPEKLTNAIKKHIRI